MLFIVKFVDINFFNNVKFVVNKYFNVFEFLKSNVKYSV